MVVDWPAPPASDAERQLATDKLALKAQIRTALAELAAKHGIAEVEVDQVMWAYVDDAVSSLTRAHERGLGSSHADGGAGATICDFPRAFTARRFPAVAT